MNWFRKHWLIVVVLVAYTLIIFLPPLMYGYVYPNNGDDTAFHLQYFSAIQSGNGATMQYLGQNIIGYPLIWMSRLLGANIDVLFLWFNLLVLWLVGIMAFVLVGKFVDWRAGLLVVPMVMFMTPSTMNLYDTGAIYDLLTIGVILSMTLFCLVKLWVTRKWYWLLPLLVVSVLALVVHTMVIWSAMQSVKAERQIPSVLEFASVFLGYGIVLLFMGVAFWIFQSKSLKIASQTKMLLFCLTSVVLPMVVLVFTGLVGWSVRLALDVSIVFPILVGCLLGIVLKGNRSKVAWGIVCVFIAVASFPIVNIYMHYNSAVSPLDKEVIAYVNNLDGDYYSCSPEVAPWIYDRFLNKKYKVGELPYIMRNEPMTSRTTPGTLAYWVESPALGYCWSEDLVPQSSGSIVQFKDNDLEIDVVR